MKKLNFWHLCLAVWLGMASLSCAQNKATLEIKEDEQLIEFTTDRFTLPNLHVTPDGENIIFDVLGDIYQVPIEGGKAEVLIQNNHWKRAGKLSPDGKTLAYVSDETGVFQPWTMDLETKQKKVYPIKEFLHYPLYAYWRNEKNLIVPTKEGLQSYDITTRENEILRPALEEEESIVHAVNRTMSINNTGRYAFFQKNEDLWAYDIYENTDLFIEPIPDKAFLESIKGSANGEKVVFYKKQKDKSKQDLISWDLSTNNLNVLNSTEIIGSSTSLNFSFDFIDDKTIVLDKEGEIIRMDIETGEYESIPIEVEVKKIIKKPLRREPQYIKDSIITASVLRNPVTRPNLDTIYFGAFGKLHSYEKHSEQIIEIYPVEDRSEISPSLSPDGKYLAYTTWNDTEMGHVYAREIRTGEEYQLSKVPGRYINPAWSPDGTEIVFVADETEAKMGLPRQSGGGNTYNYHLDLHKIKVFMQKEYQEGMQSDTIYRIYPFSQLPRRFYPIPIFHPSGSSIFITTRNHEKNLPVLIEVDLETKRVLQERLIPFHTDEVVVSPNAQHVAFIFDEQVWVDSFPQSLKLEFDENSNFISKRHHYKGGYLNNILLSEAQSVYEVAPSYLSWQDEHTLMWGSAEEVYTYDVSTGKIDKIADIKVQKPRAVPKTRYALTNARIITMNKDDNIIEKGSILVKDNRIEALGEVADIVIPKEYKVFDLEGKTIMPGIIDVHAHYHLFPYEILYQENYAYKGNLAYGVTTIYDPSVNVLDYREQAQMVETGQLLGPRIFASGNIIDEYISAYDYRKIYTNLDTDRIIMSNEKLRVSGLLKQYNRRNRKHRQWLQNSAKNKGLTLTNHETNFILAMTQIIDGYTAMEHEKYTFPLQEDIVKIIGKSGVNYTPTYMVSPGITNIYADNTKQEKSKLKGLNGSVVYSKYYGDTFENQDLETQSIIDTWNEIGKREHDRASTTLIEIINSGGKISVGGHGNPLPGIGTHWELWFMTKGMNNYKALEAATINGAEKLDLHEEMGSIESGKLADMIVLNSNPLENIFNTIDILYTIQNGNIFEANNVKHIYPNEKIKSNL